MAHAEHGGGHGHSHAEAGHGDHGRESKKMGWFKKLTSIITMTALLSFVGDLAQPFSLDVAKNMTTSGLGFMKGGKGGGGHVKHH